MLRIGYGAKRAGWGSPANAEATNPRPHLTDLRSAILPLQGKKMSKPRKSRP
jgi:hypothetical protein